MIVCLLFITLAGSFTSCTAYMNGAPERACLNLLPAHNHTAPQEGKAPYSITAHSLGNKIKVKISSPTGERFKGFMLQARSASNKENFIPGEFAISSTSQGVNCNQVQQGTLTHVNNDIKAQVETEWNGSFDGDIIFRATVVKDYEIFWANIDSDPVTVEKREIVEKPEVSKSPVCTESELCIGLPEMCLEKGNCAIVLKVKPKTSDIVQFSLSGVLEENEYMAMGISKDNRMGDDFVIECLRVGPEVRLRKSWNKGKQNENTTDMPDFGDRRLKDGETTCTWDEPKVLEFQDREYDLTNKPYILLAKGKVQKEKLEYHDKNKLSTSGPIDIFHSGSVDINEEGKKLMTGEPDAKPTTEGTSEEISTGEAHGCLQLNLNLFWLSLFVVFCTRGRNLIQ